MERTGTLVVAALLGLAAGFAGSRIGNGDSTSQAAPGTPHTVTVASTAAVGTTPDQATVSLEVTTDDPNTSTAYSKTQTDAAAVIKALEADGVARKDIKTTNLNVYSHTINHGAQTIYTASETLTAAVRKLAALSTTISDSITAGADHVQSVTFGVSDSAGAREKALASAVAGARLKADTLATAAGSHVTGVVRIQEGDVRTYPYQYHSAFSAASFGGLATSPSPIVPPHTIKTQVTVTVTWAIS